MSIAGFFVNKKVSFRKVNLDQILSFANPASETLVADNLTDLKVTLMIDKRVKPDSQIIVLTIDLGTFTNGSNTIKLQVDTSGNAVTFIKSGTVGKGTITATHNGFTRSKIVEFLIPSPDDIIKFDPVKVSSIPADGVNYIPVIVIINKNTPGGQRQVQFTTDFGSFVSAETKNTLEVVADADGKATAYLSSDHGGEVHVLVSHREVVRNKSFSFTQAWPDFLNLTVTSTVKAGLENSNSVSAKVSRTIGKPTPQFRVDYWAYDTLRREIGYFSNNVPTDGAGMAVVTYTSGDTKYRGPVKIIGALRDRLAVRDSILIKVTD